MLVASWMDGGGERGRERKREKGSVDRQTHRQRDKQTDRRTVLAPAGPFVLAGVGAHSD